MQQSAFHMEINPIWEAASGIYVKDNIIPRSVPGQMCLIQLWLQDDHATEPQSNEAESISLSVHIWGL